MSKFISSKKIGKMEGGGKSSGNSPDQPDQNAVNNILSKVEEADRMAENVAEDKDLILVVGNTGAGKSTFLNYIVGKKMIEKEIPGSMDFGFTCNDPEFEIGFGFESKTAFPQVYHDPTSNLTYCDCPGFFDNRGVDFDIANMYAIARLAESARSLKGVLILINYHTLESDRARGLREILSILRKIFSEKLNHCLPSIQILVTRLPKHITLERLRDFLSQGAEALDYPLALATNALCYDPLDRNDYLDDPSLRTSRKNLIKILQGCPGIDKTNINVVLPNDSKLKLNEILTVLKGDACNEFRSNNFSNVSYFHGLLTKLKILRLAEVAQIERDFDLFCVQEIQALSAKDENLSILKNSATHYSWLKEVIDTEIEGMLLRINEKKAAEERAAAARRELEAERKRAQERERELERARERASEMEKAEKEARKRLEEEQQRTRIIHVSSDNPIFQGYPSMPYGYGYGGMGGLNASFSNMSLGSPASRGYGSSGGRSSSSSCSSSSSGRYWVEGYTRSNGTQVRGHFKSYPRKK